jgi:hypothetical protein
MWGHFANKRYMRQIANTKYMGTDCHQYTLYGDRLQIKVHGDPFILETCGLTDPTYWHLLLPKLVHQKRVLKLLHLNSTRNAKSF